MTTPSSVRVMVVDDHPIWRDALERDLTDAGYAVAAAVGDGETALRIAAAVRPDVVLMDLQLPGMSGVDAAGALAAADPSVRILMFSSSGEDADVLAAVKVRRAGLPREVGRPRRAAGRGGPHRRGRGGVLPRPGRAGAG